MNKKSQWDKLCEHDSYNLLWATVKYDDLMQSVLQNLLLVERGKVPRLIMDCGQTDYELYRKRRDWCIKNQLIDEDELRKSVIHLLFRDNK